MAENKVNSKAMFQIGYGLYVLTSHDGVKDNGMIVNAVMQVTSSPNRVAVAINKQNYTHDVVKRTGVMNINCLTEEAPFKVFEAFGFVSGRDHDKFSGCSPCRSENGLVYLPKYINAYLSLRTEQYVDLGTHGLFICEVTEADVVSDGASMTYAYYHKYVKPKKEAPKKRGFVCKICGYVHEADELPPDFVCPICKHGAEDFERL